MSICQNCIHYEAPTDDDPRESCNIAPESVAYEMAIPCWACTVLIDSSQIIRCEEYKEVVDEHI
jgi:hypothetical protein